ncbi:MAG: hypothetical protein ACRCXZ_05765 [Patescibacteria group bacterium]
MKILKYIALILAIPTLIGVGVSAVSFLDQSENVSLTDPSKRIENLVHAGNKVEIKIPLFKDATIAGNDILIENSIERSALLAGNNITIKNANIGAGAKIAGNNITLENVTIEEDIFVAASNLNISKTKIKGDGLFATGNLTLTDSEIGRDLYYSGPKNDNLKSQVKGQLKATEEKVSSNDAKNFSKWVDLNMIFSQVLSGLIILLGSGLTLKKYNKFYDKEIGFGEFGKSSKHALFGIAIMAAIPLLLILTLVSLGYIAPLTLSASGLLVFFFFLVSPLSAYYLSNLLFKDKATVWHSLAIFVILKIMYFIPVLNVISGLIEFLLFIFTVGYFVKKTYDVKMNYLKS